MKKLLLPIFGGFLLISSVGLTTGQNVNVAIKVNEEQRVKEERILNSWQLVNSHSKLTEQKLKAFELVSQSWNDEFIDSILNQTLQYQDNQLTIDITKLDITKLPLEILENINLAVTSLNNAINLDFIKVNIANNNAIQLIYQNNKSEVLSSSSSSYMWYSGYGPSRWWKFWEWGGYIHFSEQAVQNAKWVNFFASIANIYFLFKNIRQLSNIVNDLASAWENGNVTKIDTLMKELAKLLGNFNLSLLGDMVEILAIITAIVAFGLAIITGAGWIAPLIELIIGIIASVTSQMIGADQGNGVKWQWACFIIPLAISAQ